MMTSTKRQVREFCKRCKGEITAADHEMGQCTQCGWEVTQSPMPRIRTRLKALLQKRMPKIDKTHEPKRSPRFQAFDVDEVMARHQRLIELAANRGYSIRALTALVRAAEDAYQLARA